jgi:hypothetical protein
MTKDEMLRRAAECRKLAETMGLQLFVEMAGTWEKLADQQSSDDLPSAATAPSDNKAVPVAS